MVTMFDGLTGLMAIASSASLPCMALESKFGGTDETAAPAGAVIGASNATAREGRRGNGQDPKQPPTHFGLPALAAHLGRNHATT